MNHGDLAHGDMGSGHGGVGWAWGILEVSSNPNDSMSRTAAAWLQSRSDGALAQGATVSPSSHQVSICSNLK